MLLWWCGKVIGRTGEKRKERAMWIFSKGFSFDLFVISFCEIERSLRWSAESFFCAFAAREIQVEKEIYYPICRLRKQKAKKWFINELWRDSCGLSTFEEKLIITRTPTRFVIVLSLLPLSVGRERKQIKQHNRNSTFQTLLLSSSANL